MFRGGGYGGGQSSINANPPAPPNAVDPGMWARLLGYAGGFNPIASAHAGGAPDPDSPAARQAAIAAAAAQMNNGGPGASQGPQGPPVPPGVVPPVVAAPPTPETLQRIQETINGGGAPVGGGGSSGGGGASAAYRPSEFEPAGRHMPAPARPGAGREPYAISRSTRSARLFCAAPGAATASLAACERASAAGAARRRG